MLTRQDCTELDANDALADLRGKFRLPEGVIYLDGNSLGAMPGDVPDKLMHTIEREWGKDLIRSWGTADWFAMPEKLGDRIGRLIGAAAGQIVVCDTTSINIYKALRAAMRMRSERSVIVSELGSFPTDLYMIEGAIGGDGAYSSRLLGRDGEKIEDLLDEDVAVVLLSNVDYRTGRLHDMEAITRSAHDCGALIIWDLCHSAGVVPMKLDDLGVDFAVGCTYKYLNGGPGSPAYIYVSRRHHDSANQPLSGWWGHAAPFAFEPSYKPTEGVRRFLCGTQPILSMKGVEAAMDLFDGMDMTLIRQKSQKLGDTFIRLVEQHPSCRALELASPRDAEKRGSQVSFDFVNGYPVIRAMIEKGVIGDYREPGIMRFGLAPYYLRYVDLYDAVQIMAKCIEAEVWNIPAYVERETVT